MRAVLVSASVSLMNDDYDGGAARARAAAAADPPRRARHDDRNGEARGAACSRAATMKRFDNAAVVNNTRGIGLSPRLLYFLLYISIPVSYKSSVSIF